MRVEPYTLRGESHTKSNATKIGGGAALGAVIGAIAGGGKGAAVGTVVGAGAGTGVAAASGKKDATIESEAVLSFVVSAEPPPAAGAPPPPPPNAPPPAEMGADRGDAPYPGQPGDPNGPRFSLRDQRLIRNCFSEHVADLPPEMTRHRETQDSQLQPGQILPPGLEKRVRPLPDVCENQLAPLPGDLERVVYHRWVMLLDAQSRVLDSFDLDK